MTYGGRAIYLIAMERQEADRRRATADRRAEPVRPDYPSTPLPDLHERRRAALGSLRRWFVASRTAEALR